MTDAERTEEDWRAWEAGIMRLIQPLVRERKFAQAIEELRRRLASESDVERRASILQTILPICTMAGRQDEVFAVHRELIALQPDEPINWCSLAHSHMSIGPRGQVGESAGKEALAAIETAVEKARASGSWLWYCLCDRCRIALDLKRYDILEDSMRKILEDRPRPPDAQDYGPEDEFLKRIPEGAVDPALIERYRAAVAGHRARRARERRTRGEDPTSTDAAGNGAAGVD